MDIELILAWPPSVNSYYSHTKRGVFLSGKGRQYRKLVENAVNEQLAGLETVEDGVLAEVILHPPDKRKRDIDNHMKGLLDALTNAQVWEDDSQVHQLMIYRGAVQSGGVCIVRISEAGPIIPIVSRG